MRLYSKEVSALPGTIILLEPAAAPEIGTWQAPCHASLPSQGMLKSARKAVLLAWPSWRWQWPQLISNQDLAVAVNSSCVPLYALGSMSSLKGVAFCTVLISGKPVNIPSSNHLVNWFLGP